MATFKMNERVFDIRYGWGVVIGEELNGTKHVKFETTEHIMVYSKEFINTILSLSEYRLDGQTLPEGDTEWDEIREEWMNNGENIELFAWLSQNMQAPVRK
jgi:hypothetical protein